MGDLAQSTIYYTARFPSLMLFNVIWGCQRKIKKLQLESGERRRIAACLLSETMISDIVHASFCTPDLIYFSATEIYILN